jgi:hypothetical protein
MPWMGFEPTIPASERAKGVNALDRVATATQIIRRIILVSLKEGGLNDKNDGNCFCCAIFRPFPIMPLFCLRSVKGGCSWNNSSPRVRLTGKGGSMNWSLILLSGQVIKGARQWTKPGVARMTFVSNFLFQCAGFRFCLLSWKSFRRRLFTPWA